MKKRFFGGVHPAGKKDLPGRGAPVPAPVPPQVVIPLRQHIGAFCQPLVQVGDRVKVGQKIGDGGGLCVPVHASVSGRVVAIEARPHISGTDVESIVIENDGQDTFGSGMTAYSDISGLGREQLLDIIHEAGIVGMGGATFPTDVKANVPLGQIDTVIVNACECEPYITADDILMCSYPRQVLEGLRVMVQIAEPKRVIFAVEDNKPEAIASIRKQLPDYPGVELEVLPTRYPQGSEKQLIAAVTGREVPSGKLPKDVGCVVFNAATYASIHLAVYEGKPLTHRIVTVTGEGVQKPTNFIVPIGTPFSLLLEAAGGLKEETVKVIAGGPMMGTAQKHLDGTVVKGTNGIVCLTEMVAPKNLTCIRCGKCADNCPMQLQPLYLFRYEEAGDYDELKRLHVMDCMECGCCAYGCPQKLPLVDRIRAAKRAIREGK